MSSFLVWRKDTKEIYVCMGEAIGTTFTLEALVGRMPGWEDIYSGAEVFPTINTTEAKAKFYVNENDEFQPRPEIPITVSTSNPVMVNGEAVVTVNQVPVGTEVIIDGVSQGETTEDPFELAFDLVGTYQVTFRKYPYLDREVIFNATY